LWRRIIRHVKQKTVVIAPKSLRPKIISDTHADIMTGHKSKNQTKKRIFSSYRWPGIDTEIDIHIKSCDKCQRTQKTRGEVQLLQVLYHNVMSRIRESTWTCLNL
jgi:hypothetical protein